MLACSKRSDSGERCEVKTAMKSRGGLGREVRESDCPDYIIQSSFVRKNDVHLRKFDLKLSAIAKFGKRK